MSKIIAYTIIVFSITLSCFAQHKHSEDKPSIHGMLIFGIEKIYASHLPMFHSPHDYQIILELELNPKDKKKFINYQKKYPTIKTYTIAPEVFILPEKIKQNETFKAILYSNHFERGGKIILDSIQIKILEVIYFKKFDSTLKEVKETRYLLFGNKKEQFAVHIIQKRPDFDQINQIEIKNLEKPIEVITNKETNTVLGIGGNEQIFFDRENKKYTIFWLYQLYLEFKDLE